MDCGVTEAGAVAAAVVDTRGNRAVKTKRGDDRAPTLTLAKPTTVESWRWVLPESEFREGVVGGKSLNLAALRAHLPPNVHAPTSIALPFGAFERALKDDTNKEAAAAIKTAERAAGRAPKGSGVPPALAELRRLIAGSLHPPPGLAEEVRKK